MKLSVVAFILVAALCRVVPAANKCGKAGLKVKYGQTKEFTSPSLERGSCRYRLKVDRGLHVKLTLNQFDSDHGITVYDATAQPFKMRTARTLSMPSRPQPRGTVVPFETNMIAVKLEFSPGTSPISFTYEAVIPSDGNFGSDLQAVGKLKVIKTPGFPKTPVPSGTRSTWNIRANENEKISISFLSFRTISDEDYIEVYDGDELLGKHSGKMNKRSRIEYDATSGLMKIYLHTTTAKSKGFKAKFRALPKATVTETPSDITCHKRNRVLSNGMTLSDDHSSMTCSSGEICGRMVVEGTSKKFSSFLIMSETLHCIPRSLCGSGTDPCSQMPTDPSVVVKSCNVTCCDTSMCNQSPDGPEVPPTPVPGASTTPSSVLWPWQPTGLYCNQRSEITTEGGPSLGSASSGEPCPSGSICGLYVFEGTSDGNPAHGYSAMCTTESECNEEGCSSIPDARYINITTCKVMCCKTDRCNRVPEEPVPTSLLPPEPTVQCYNILFSRSGDTILVNERSVTDCFGQDAKCLRVDARATDSSGREVNAAYGGCGYHGLCASADCSPLHDSLSIGNLNSCNARCCDGNLCNDNTRSTDSELPGSRVRCHRQSKVVGQSVSGAAEPSDFCPAGNVCGIFIFNGTDDGAPVSGYSATCVPQSQCNLQGCSSLPETESINIVSCKATCCNSNFCNEPPSSTTTPSEPSATGFVGRCYDILSTRVGTTQALDKRDPMTCDDASSKCLRLDAVATDAFGNEVTMAFGRCVPAISCSAVDCKLMSPAMPGIDVTACNAQCCDTDMCNGNALEPEAIPERSEPPAVASGGPSIRCNEILELHGMGMLLPGSYRREKQCDSGSSCLSIVASATHSSFPGIKMTTTYGACMPSAACGTVDCSSLPTSMDGVAISGCKVSCCDTDLCNT